MIITNGNYDDTVKIYNSLTDVEKEYIDSDGFEKSPFVVCRKVLYINDLPISFIEIIEMPDYKNNGYVVAATRKEYRNKGFVKLLVKMAEQELNNITNLIWLYDKENLSSEKTAISLNFEKVKNGRYERRLIC